MMKYPCLLLFLAITQLASIAHSRVITPAEAISALCQDQTIILLGETHHKPESQMMFLDLVRNYVEQGKRVYVGLEIPADKQTQLDDALAGGRDFLFISPIILHDQYEVMIHSLGSMEGNVTVRAIDAEKSEPIRDAAMSRNIASAASSGKYDKILVLVGNVHVIENIQWNKEMTSSEKYFAGHLIEVGPNPCTIQQLFTGKGGKPLLVRTDIKEGASLALQVISPVNHSEDMEGSDVCDAVVVWK